MAVTVEAMQTWCERLLGAAPEETHLPLAEYLEAIPRLESLADAPEGTPVLVRGDVDAKPGPEVGQGDIRLRSMQDTLDYGRQKGWKQIIFGHIGRKPEGSLGAVRGRLREILDCPIAFVEDWLDEESLAISDKLASGIQKSPPGSVILLENTRKYAIERALWKAAPDDIPALAPQLAKLANQFAEKVASHYVNEALSAGSLDASSTIVPAAMQRAALGSYVAAEFTGPMMQCREASLVVFSGLKIDKLDDLQAIVERGTVRMVIAAGSLAMALKEAEASLAGGEFCFGVAEDPAHADKPYYIPPQRVEQAKAMLSAGREKGIEFVLPIDFILQDGRAAETIGPADQQFDVGPKSSALFADKVGQFIDAPAEGTKVAFHNGVFGMFEDERFEAGTRQFVAQLKRMHDAGVEVYVGGGEGGKALERYGQEDWVTHVFTAGGTVLNALGSEPVPYLLALKMAAGK